MNTLSGLADFSPEKLPAPASTHYSKTDLTHTPAQFLDRSTLASWIKARESMLMLYARQLLPAGDRAYAEDVVQELFVKLLAQASPPGQLPRPRNPAAWLHTCVRNAAEDARRASARWRQREHEAGRVRGAWFQSNADDLLDAGLAQSALESLPDSIREVVVLRIWSSLTLADIAAVVGAPVSTVHDRYKKGLAMVRGILERRTTHV